MNKAFRTLLIDILDNENGIPEATFHQLQSFSVDYFGNFNDDVFSAVDAVDGQFFLNEDFAHTLRVKTHEIQ